MTTQRLNIKFLVYLGLGSLVFLVSVYGLHKFQVGRNAAGLLLRADAAREEGDLAESARLRARYVYHRPEDLPQYKEIALDLKKSLFDKARGRQDIDRQEVLAARTSMDNAIVKNGTDVELRREAADFWFQIGSQKDAIEHLEVYRDEWNDTDRMQYINSLIVTGQESLAMEELETVLGWDQKTNRFDADPEKKATHPHLLDAYRALVALQIQKRLDREGAVNTMNHMVLSNPKDAKAYLLRSRLFMSVSKGQGIEESHRDISDAYALAPNDIDVITAMSGMYLQTERSEDAKRLIQLGLEQAESVNEKARLYKLLAEVFITVSDNEGALTILDKGNREVPKDRDLLWTKARLLLDQKRHKEVEAMYKPLKKAGHDESMIGYLRARILMDNGEYLKATKGLRTIRNVLPANMQLEVDTFLSQGYAHLGKSDLQLGVLRSMREKAPNNEQLNKNYLQILLQLRRTKEAQEFVTARVAELKAANKPIPRTYDLAMMTLQMNDIRLSNRQLSATEQAALDAKFEETLNDESIPEVQRQQLLLRRLRQNNDPAAAKATLKKAILAANRAAKANPDAPPKTFLLWAMLIDYAEGEAEALKFFKLMEKSVDLDSYRAALTTIRAKIAVKHAPETAGDVLQSIEDGLGQFTNDQQASLLFELGRLQYILKDRSEANRLLEKSLERKPNNVTILSTLFEDAVAQSDPERVSSIARRIRKAVGSDDDAYRIVEAKRIVWMIRNKQTSESERAGELRKARDLIQRIRSVRKEWLPGILVESDIHRLDAKPVAAIELLEIAHRLQNTNPQIIRAIAQSYQELRQPAKASEWMKKLPNSFRNESDNRVVLSTLWRRRSVWSKEDGAKAVELLEEIAPADSDTVKNQLLRSQIYLHLKHMDKAEVAAKRALEIDKSEPDVWTNLVNIFQLQGKRDQALKLIQAVDSQVPEEVKPVVLGRCYAIMKDLNQAQQNFLLALRNDPSNAKVKRMLAEVLVADKKFQQAASVIQSIVKNADSSKDPLTVVWARRSLAKIYASTKNYQAFQKALTLLEGNAVNGELSREDLSLLVAFSYARPEMASWDRALIRIEQIAKKRALTDDELFMKAQLYEKYGDEYWPEVKKMTTGVLSRNSSNTAAVDSFVRWLLKRGEVSEAERWAENSLAKGATTRFRVDLHVDAKRGEFKRAATKIQQRTPANLDDQGTASQQLTLAALAEELGQYDPRFYKMAEQMLRKLASKVPSEILRVASVLGTHGDTAEVKEALGMCFNATPPDVQYVVSAGVALAVLRQHPEDWDGPLSSSIRDVGQWLDRTAAANADDLILRWRVAEFYDMIGELDRVEEAYRALLASPEFDSPTDRGMVMNNLAYAMALNGKTSEPMKLVLEAEKIFLGPTADLIDTRGFIHYVDGKTDEAIKDFQTAIASGSKSGQKFFHLALAFNKKKDRTKAETNWKEALRKGLDRFKLPPALRPEFDKLQGKFGGTPVAQL